MTEETPAARDQAERLIAMANQIAAFFTAYPREEAVAGVASHLNQFWDVRMRRRFLAAAEERPERLHPLVGEAKAAVKR